MEEINALRIALIRQLIDLATSGGLVWERSTARYRDKATGRFVAEATIKRELDTYNAAVAETVQAITDNLLNGRLTVAQWQTQFAETLRDVHIVNLQIGRGGKAATTFADYGRIGARLKKEYGFLNGFAQDIADGKLTEAQIKARAAQYVEAIKASYQDGKTAAAAGAGFTEERRVLQPGESCEDCIGYEAKGWQPLGSLPQPGEASQCRHNCNCIKEYR